MKLILYNWRNFLILLHINLYYFKIIYLNNVKINKLIIYYQYLINFFFYKNNLYFICLNYFYYYNYLLFLIIFCSFFLKYINNIFFYKFYKFLAFIGLGFKKKLLKIKKNFLILYLGHRDWIIFFFPSTLLCFYFLRRKSIVIFSKNKNLLKFYLSYFKSFKKENFFKLKGLLDIRSKRRWLFTRRIKVYGLKVKLSKKQKVL